MPPPPPRPRPPAGPGHVGAGSRGRGGGLVEGSRLPISAFSGLPAATWGPLRPSRHWCPPWPGDPGGGQRWEREGRCARAATGRRCCAPGSYWGRRQGRPRQPQAAKGSAPAPGLLRARRAPTGCRGLGSAGSGEGRRAAGPQAKPKPGAAGKGRREGTARSTQAPRPRPKDPAARPRPHAPPPRTSRAPAPPQRASLRGGPVSFLWSGSRPCGQGEFGRVRPQCPLLAPPGGQGGGAACRCPRGRAQGSTDSGPAGVCPRVSPSSLRPTPTPPVPPGAQHPGQRPPPWRTSSRPARGRGR